MSMTLRALLAMFVEQFLGALLSLEIVKMKCLENFELYGIRDDFFCLERVVMLHVLLKLKATALKLCLDSIIMVMYSYVQNVEGRLSASKVSKFKAVLQTFTESMCVNQKLVVDTGWKLGGTFVLY